MCPGQSGPPSSLLGVVQVDSLPLHTHSLRSEPAFLHYLFGFGCAAVLGGFSLVAVSRDHSPGAACRPLIAVASPVAEPGPKVHGLQ